MEYECVYQVSRSPSRFPRKRIVNVVSRILFATYQAMIVLER